MLIAVPDIQYASSAWQADCLYHWANREALMMKPVIGWTTASCTESNLCSQQHVNPRVILNHWAGSALAIVYTFHSNIFLHSNS